MYKYSFFKYLDFCCNLLKKNKISFEEWCYQVDNLNRKLISKYQIRWETDHWLWEIIRDYYKSGYGPEKVSEKDYIDAVRLDSKFEDVIDNTDILDEFDPPEDFDEFSDDDE